MTIATKHRERKTVDVRDAVFGIRSRQRFLAHLARFDLPEGPGDPRPVTDEDASLPDPAQRYMRFMGVVGRPRDWSFRARLVGGMWSAPGKLSGTKTRFVR